MEVLASAKPLLYRAEINSKSVDMGCEWVEGDNNKLIQSQRI